MGVFCSKLRDPTRIMLVKRFTWMVGAPTVVPVVQSTCSIAHSFVRVDTGNMRMLPVPVGAYWDPIEGSCTPLLNHQQLNSDLSSMQGSKFELDARTVSCELCSECLSAALQITEHWCAPCHFTLPLIARALRTRAVPLPTLTPCSGRLGARTMRMPRTARPCGTCRVAH